MLEKEFNEEQYKKYAKRNEYGNSQTPSVDWVGSKQFKRLIKFRVFPANSKEDKRIGGGFVSGVHWIADDSGKQFRYQCPEETFPESGVVCPVCQMRRELEAAGYTQEELSTNGIFGPVSIFKPRKMSAIKCLVTETDLVHNWDQAHISILQQNGDYMLEWLVRELANREKPNFADWERGAVIKFSRDTDNGKWNREVLPDSVDFNLWHPTPEILQKVKNENEQITVSELYRLPTDTQTMEIKEVLTQVKARIQREHGIKGTNTAATQDDSTMLGVLNNFRQEQQYQEAVKTYQTPADTFPQTQPMMFQAPQPAPNVATPQFINQGAPNTAAGVDDSIPF